ncbi:RNA 2',3'-cyclic phosphodiesterase [Conexibacter sp. W3-3-2]|uniref:RNA 2',3'-cyclic phosphodiesterase n=1 Tax=Conexibacter sp. W3-3-2 TaxID=2675227 RepID=UPI0012B74F60|nr:RNA 2',3'-cyclic phosphodiesterase [Conexibacter sp. W3-3-2]MTD46054.1 RNA 2',3'-cyclic phosphodiesterase [Conexibacter sp. W3-3-2]
MTRPGHRLFVAVAPPPRLADELAAWARAHRGAGLRPVPPANVHVTLAFLGARPAADVEAALRAVRAGVDEWTLTGGRAPVELALAGPCWLPPRRPRALAVDVVDSTAALGELRDRIVRALDEAVGFAEDHARFRPHVTVARGAGRAVQDGGAPLLGPSPQATFPVDVVTLHRSFLEPGGARYEALGDVPLG